MKPNYKPEKDYTPTTEVDNTRKKAPEQPTEQRLSPSGTTRSHSKQGGERAKEKAMREMRELLE
jgi:hypothetical protein